ncbi:MAG: VapE domain-containing protein [Prevotella sp.]
MNVSIFHDMTCKLPLPGLLEGVANLIRTDEKLAVFTRSYRQTGSKTFKNESQLFAVPCLFEGGKGRSNIRQLTGMSLVDFDHAIGSEERGVKSEESISDGEWKAFIAKELNILKRKAIADPHTLLCYITMSGNGLRVIFTYEIAPEFSGVPKDEEEVKKFEAYYQQAFYAGNAYYEKLLGAKADMQCKNITRLSGLAHDLEVFLRPQSEVIPFTAEEISTAATAYVKQSKEDKQMQRIQTYFDTLIAPQLAKAKIEFRSGCHNDYVMRVGYKLAERRFSKKVALRWAMQKFGKDYSDTEQVINSCFANASPHGKQGGSGDNRGDSKTATVEEIKSFLDGHISLRFNEITSRVEYEIPADNTDAHRFMPVNDRIVNSLWSQMSTITRVNIQDMYRVIESDYVPVFNPFKEYLNNLSKPGEQDYIRELAQTVRVKGGEQEQKLWHLYLKKWLVGMVASWISEDVVNNVILVLIGEQGAYKTTWFNYLLPPPLKQYFYTKTNANRMSKDDILTLAQYALVCCEELDTMRPAELNQLKAAVTMPSIDERAAYAHYHEHRKHIASFCGTGNNTQFLSDPTGNRRWLPFEVESILSPREHPFHYEGIYAQALSLYTSGFQYWFTKEEIQELNRHNKQFETPHLEHELVDLYFRRPIDSELGEFISVARALQMISNGISQKLSAVNVGRAFSDLGFKRVRTNSSRGFIVVCRTPEEIKAYQHRLLMDAEPDSSPEAPF